MSLPLALQIADEQPAAYRVNVSPNDAILDELTQVEASLAILRKTIAKYEKRKAELIASLRREGKD